MAITLRPDERTNRFIEGIKQRHGFKTATKTIEYALEHHTALFDQLEAANDEIRDLTDRIDQIQELITDKAAIDAKIALFAGIDRDQSNSNRIRRNYASEGSENGQ